MHLDYLWLIIVGGFVLAAVVAYHVAGRFEDGE